MSKKKLKKSFLLKNRKAIWSSGRCGFLLLNFLQSTNFYNFIFLIVQFKINELPFILF